MYGCCSTCSIAAAGVSATGSATMSGRGTITSSTGVSEKSKTLSIISCSSGSSTPRARPGAAACAARPRCAAPSSSSVVLMPSRRMTSCASQSRNVMNQLNVKKNDADRQAPPPAPRGSARGSVYDFGTISPITTCRIEITRTRRPPMTAVATPARHAADRGCSSTRATAGSPSAPSASDESVMPSCIAEMKCDGSATILRTVRARRLPSLTSSSRRVWRTETNAYSAATKNAFQSTQKTIRASSTAVTALMRRTLPGTPTQARRFVVREGDVSHLPARVRSDVARRSRRLLERDRPDGVKYDESIATGVVSRARAGLRARDRRPGAPGSRSSACA